MKNRILIACMALFAITTLYAYDFKYGDLYYNIIDNNEVEVTYEVYWSSSNYSKLESVDIDNSVTYNGKTYSVTCIGDDAFCRCSELTSIIISNSVTSIGSNAFRDCSGLTSITIPNSVTSIGSSAFKGVNNIEYVGIAVDAPWGAKSINGYVDGYLVYADSTMMSLLGCSTSAIGDITIPNSVMSIGNSAFEDCKSLTSITIPNSVMSIGNSAFEDCKSLTSITIPNSVTSIGSYAFFGCKSLTSITIPNSVTSISSGVLGSCKGLTSITIPNSVTNIGEAAFIGCSGLTSITIPIGVISIGEYAFKYCDGLKSVIWNAKKCKCGNDIYGLFYYAKDNITSFTFGKEVDSIPSVCYGLENLTSITIPNSVTSIGDCAFCGCSGLTSINIPNSVTHIGGSAFYGCSGLTSIIIPNGVTDIKNGTFSGCSGLTSITIPNTVTDIWNNAFYGCSGLTSITIPSRVRNIARRAFYGCSGLTSIIIPNGVTSIGSSAFYGCKDLTSVTIPNSVTSIDSYAFSGCSGVTSITIPNGVTSIGDCAFNEVLNIVYAGSAMGAPWGAKSMNGYVDGYLVYLDTTKQNLLFCSKSAIGTITIPNSVTSIGNGVFSGCSGLTSITIPSSVTSIGNGAFSACSGLDTVIWNARNCQGWSQYKDSPFYVENGESSISSFIFGNEVENVPDYLCYGLNKLTSVTIPNSVQSVGGMAFANCKYLEEVSFGTGIEEIGENAFAGDERIYSVTCYADVTPTIYKSTFSGVSSNAELHVLANLVKKYKVNEYWSKFTIVPISVDNTTNGTLTVRPSDTDATFTWPADSNADSYTLTIKKGDVVFCRLIFNGEGQLLSIAFAPTRGETKHTPAASLSAEGYKFTVTGLDEASHYTYQIVVEDWENKVLNTYEGEFNTNGYTAIDRTTMQESGTDVRKVLRDGQVYILRAGKTYTLTGSEID